MRLLRPRDPCGRLRRSLAQASKARQPNRAHRQARPRRACGRRGPRLPPRARGHPRPRRAAGHRPAQARRPSPARGHSRARAQVQSRRAPQEWVRRPPRPHLRQVRGEPQLRKPPRAQAHNRTQKPRQTQPPQPRRTQMKHGRVQALKPSQVPGGPHPRHDRTP